jgi:hypothetical protein
MSASNIIRLLNVGLIEDDKFDMVAGEVANFLPAVDDTGKFAFGDGTTDCDVQVFLGDSSTYALFDVGNAQLNLAGVDITSNAAINSTATSTLTTLNATTINATTGNITTVVATNSNATTFTGTTGNITNVAATNSNAATFVATTAVNTVDLNVTGNTALVAVSLTGIVTPSANGYVALKSSVLENTAARTVTAADYDKIIELNGAAGATTVSLPAPAAGNVGASVRVVSLSNHAHIVSSANTIVALTSIVADSLTAAEVDKTGQFVKLTSDASKWIVTQMTGAWTVTAA